ncbi:Carbonic anhydrase or acetyltransferase, isoleucine patch superfamily [Fodinibius roseus]|uniref:Carbonic anhydrase or acetyltransferase, isoleucine patch superfamily n=1 Tax=Fodinibius roseus TaxID=1194090 RepID=A0A1M5IIJ9_9BACT|nr:gamma carbonic anhydrase family protein [Fodinibius roseus]SHG28091.1 Carbonic anhydrase or acetyltransferase, isoleucine patch superfamily [Fodinibius roseus]
MIYEFLDRKPDYPESVFVAPSADMIGDVTLGEESSVWFNTTIRGDVNWIEIGARTNIQDNTCIHVMNQTGPTTIGDEVTIGHNAMVHGCTIHDRVLVGIHATVLDKAIIESDVIVAAGSLVPPGQRLESGYLYMGSPARQKRKLTEEEIVSIKEHSDNYVTYARAYMQKDTYDKNPFYEKNN